MTAIQWIEHDERVVGRNHPTLTDVVNRPLESVLTQSGLSAVDESFPGFLLRHTGAGSPEGVLDTTQARAYVDTATGVLYIKQSNGGSTGWTRQGNRRGSGSPE